MAWLRDAQWLNRNRLLVYPKLIFIAYVVTYSLWLAAAGGLVDRATKPIGVDFSSFWTASAAALEGKAPSAYDLAAHYAMEQEALGPQTFLAPWYYPPTFLILVLPLALLPYLWSLLVWSLLGLGLYLLVIRRIEPRPEALWIALAFPGAFANLINGQNGLMVVAVFGTAMLLLEERPVVAGLLCGVLTIKPQIGVLIPIALIAGARWRALIAAAAGTICFSGLSLLLFGAQTWRAFLNSLDLIRHAIIENGAIRFYTMQTSFAAVRLLGGTITTAYAVQAAAFIAAAIAVVWVWRRRAPFAVQAAALMTGTLLSSFYVIYYDLALLALPIAWLAAEGEHNGFLPFEKSILVAAWLLPLICEPLAEYLALPLAPIVSLLMFAMILRRAGMELSGKQAEDFAGGAPSIASPVR